MTDLALFREYEPHELGDDDYPRAWHVIDRLDLSPAALQGSSLAPPVGVKDLVREEASRRCIRCGHPYTPGCGTWDPPETVSGNQDEAVTRRVLEGWEEEPPDWAAEDPLSPRARTLWSPCDERCTHLGPYRFRYRDGGAWSIVEAEVTPLSAGSLIPERVRAGAQVEAAWRILTVHHLNERKHDLRWWNLVSLCQRCHLLIQRKVTMDAPYPWEHTPWFAPYAAAHYAYKYLGETLTREQTMERLGDLLAVGQREESVERMAL